MEEKGKEAGAVCGGHKTPVGPCPWLKGSTGVLVLLHPPSQPASPQGHLDVGDVEATTAGCGVSFLLRSPSSACRRGGIAASAGQGEMSRFSPRLSSGGW